MVEVPSFRATQQLLCYDQLHPHGCAIGFYEETAAAGASEPAVSAACASVGIGVALSLTAAVSLTAVRGLTHAALLALAALSVAKGASGSLELLALPRIVIVIGE